MYTADNLENMENYKEEILFIGIWSIYNIVLISDV